MIIALPNGKATTRVGFGCSGLNGGSDRKNSLRLVEAALAAGIRHFDVAPSYGNGQAEAILGEALAWHRDAVTISTKYGIPRPRNQGLIATARSLLKPVLAALPAEWRERARKQTIQGSAAGQGRLYDPAALAESVHESLAQLKTGHVDILLMHELRAESYTADLGDKLQLLRGEGLIGLAGIGSSRTDSRDLCEHHPQILKVAQYEWSICDEPIQPAGSTFTITHRSIRSGQKAFEHLKRDHSALVQSMSRRIDADLFDTAILAGLLLGAALDANRNGIVLASTSNPARVDALSRAAGDETLIDKGRQLYQEYRTWLATQSER